MSPAALSQNSRELAQERLLDVTYLLVDQGGWDALRMTHVAKAAGVSRQTAYNEFGSKAGLGRALIEREIKRFLKAVQEQVAPCGNDPMAAVRAGVLFTLRQAEANWVLKSILSAGRAGEHDLVSMATSGAEPLLPDAIAALRGYADSVWPEIGADVKDLLIETLIRVTVSHAVVPIAPPEEIAAQLSRLTAHVLL